VEIPGRNIRADKSTQKRFLIEPPFLSNQQLLEKNLIAFFKVSVKFNFFLSLSVNGKAVYLCVRPFSFAKTIVETPKERLRIDSS
jgi:hypothetical protein